MSAVVLWCFSFWRCFRSTSFVCFHPPVFQREAFRRPVPRSTALPVVILRSLLPQQISVIVAVRDSRKRVTLSHDSPAPTMHTTEAAHIAAARRSGQRPGFPGRLRAVHSNCRFAFALLHFQLPSAPLPLPDTTFSHPARPHQRLANYPHGCAFPGFHSALLNRPRTVGRILLRFFQALSG